MSGPAFFFGAFPDGALAQIGLMSGALCAPRASPFTAWVTPPVVSRPRQAPSQDRTPLMSPGTEGLGTAGGEAVPVGRSKAIWWPGAERFTLHEAGSWPGGGGLATPRPA